MTSTFIFLIVILLYRIISAESQCGEWITYKDIKCFKIFESSGLQAYEDAINSCHQQSNDSNLISITSAEEQAFLTNLIFTTNQIVDNVWIGAKYVNSQYKWLNGANLSYSNWAEGYPKNITDDCVEMHSDTGSVGKWVDTSCKRKNLVVCEYLPNWSINRIQQTVLSLMDKVSTLEKSESSLKETISNLKQNIPIGFIYVQFANEKLPQDIWPSMTWTEITSSYAGLFFRAFGGNSSSFGSTQEANAPRITNIQTEIFESHRNASDSFEVTINEDDWSGWLYAGGSRSGNFDIRFASSGGEVRPRNTAIRIWKRNA